MPVPWTLALLLKLLFANEKLSIQVHPDDTFARSMGLPLGKTEAWYILSATPDAKVAAGLKRHLTTQELRTSIEDGTIAECARPPFAPPLIPADDMTGIQMRRRPLDHQG